MAGHRITRRYVYGINADLVNVFPDPIVTERAPTATDRAQIGQVWINSALDDIYFLTSIVAGNSIWINAGGGGGVFTAVTVDPGNLTVVTGDIDVTAGNITIDAGDFEVTLGSLTVGVFGAGIVTSSAAGLFSSTAGTDGQLIIGATAAAPAWASVVSGDGSVVIAAGANTLDLRVSGAAASTFPTDAGTATPALGATTIAGGTNINTAGAGSTVTINVDTAPTFAGLVTANLGILVDGADVNLVSATNTGQDIYLHANGGIAETIDIYADQGTGVDAAASVYVHSDDGGVTVASNMASAQAIRINASNAVGGIDVDCGSGDFILDSGGVISLDAVAASNFTVTGASLDLTLGSVGGSVVVTANEAVADAVQLTASDAAGGVTVAAGAGGFICGATNGPITITSGTGAIDIGTDAAAHIVTVGSTNTASQTIIQSGTGDVNVTSTDAITLDCAGVLELNSTAGVIGIGSDADAQNINIGTGAAVRTITIGNVTGATAIALNAGTGSIALVSTGAGDITLDSADTLLLDCAGVLELNSSAGVIGIGNDGDAQNINIGTGAAVRIVTVGNATGATSVVLNSGTGNLDLGVTATDHTSRMGSTTGTSATTIQAGTGALTFTAGGAFDVNATGNVTIDSSGGTLGLGEDAIAQNINIGTGGAARTITIGNVTGATAIALNAGTGSIALVSTGAGDITLDSADTLLLDCAGVLELNSSAGVIGIGNDGDAQNINIGTGAAVRIVTVGNATGATSVVLNSGTGAVELGINATDHSTTMGSTTGTSATTVQAGTGALTMTAGGIFDVNATGNVTIDSSGGTLGLGEDAIAQNINIGTGGAARTITVGNVTGATSVVVDVGTGACSFGASATTHVTTIGSINTTSQTIIQSGTGNVNITSTDDITIDCAGVLELNSTAGVIGIGSDGDANNINIGTGAAARTITIGNVTGATAVNLNAGTGGIALASTGAGDITIDSDDTVLIDADGVLEFNSSAGVISIGNDGDANNINIGTGAAARIITVGNATGATSIVLNSGTGAVELGINATDHSTTMGSTTGTSATTIQAGTGALTMTAGGIFDVNATGNVTIDSSGGTLGLGEDADAQNINIGTGGAVRVITIGNVTGATAVNLNAGTAGIALASTGAGDITIDSSDTVLIDAAGVIEINSTAGVIGIGSDADAQNINIGTGGAARVITIGNVTGATAVNLNAGTAGIALASTGAGDITIDSSDTILIDAAGVIEINSTAGVIGIGNDADAQNINIGTGGAVRSIAIGNATGATDISLDSGSGGIDINAPGGILSATPGTGTVAGVALTLNARLGVCEFTGQTTGAGADLDIDITNSFMSAGIGVLVTVGNEGANDADITVEGVNTHTAGHLIIHCINSGAAALNGDVTVTFWIIN